ncbi:hypothetical protein GW17_00019908 [Ensete ventricosum]|nr:hypothetical protein GW17_00019908 [Ensete ventricosum]
MEFWARWAHRALWHASLWNMHESHHRPRDGPFELNDVFAIINAVPAISLMAYGFLNRGLLPGLCFGAVILSSLPSRPGFSPAPRGQNLQGLGITLFGMAYMFVHDGLVHRRFPVGPIANVPYFRRVAAAHQVLPSVSVHVAHRRRRRRHQPRDRLISFTSFVWLLADPPHGQVRRGAVWAVLGTQGEAMAPLVGCRPRSTRQNSGRER